MLSLKRCKLQYFNCSVPLSTNLGCTTSVPNEYSTRECGKIQNLLVVRFASCWQDLFHFLIKPSIKFIEKVSDPVCQMYLQLTASHSRYSWATIRWKSGAEFHVTTAVWKTFIKNVALGRSRFTSNSLIFWNTKNQYISCNVIIFGSILLCRSIFSCKLVSHKRLASRFLSMSPQLLQGEPGHRKVTCVLKCATLFCEMMVLIKTYC